MTSSKNRWGWLGVLAVATISGILVRIFGDPIAEFTTPVIENFLQQTQDGISDQIENLPDRSADEPQEDRPALDQPADRPDTQPAAIPSPLLD